MRKLLALLLSMVLLLNAGLSLADQPYEAAMRKARQTLENRGYPVSDNAFAMAVEQINTMQDLYARAGFQATVTQHDMVYQLLLCEGIPAGAASGAVAAAAVQLASLPENAGKRIVALLPTRQEM